jgi:hypothetical protein
VKWLDRDGYEEAQEKPKWSPEPKCSCRNEGKPYLLDGNLVTSLDPACRVHPTILSASPVPVSAESIVGNWKDREKEK